MSDRDGGSIGWFLAGLGIGAVVGILYAPRSGTETRDVLRSKAEEGRDYVRNRANEAREQATDWVNRGRDVINQQKEQFKSAYEAGRQAYQEATSGSAEPGSKNV
jgi:gas vesicle protein